MYRHTYYYTGCKIVNRAWEDRNAIIDKLMRRNAIIDFITKYPGCNKEKAFKGVENYMARVTFFSTLTELNKEGIVTEGEKDKPKSRDHKLFVNNYNLLVIIPKELEQFENAFFVLLKKSLDLSAVQSDLSVAYDLISGPLFLFYEMVNAYLVLALSSWPMIVLEKDTLRKLYTIVFTKLGEMQIRIYDMLKRSKFANVNQILPSGMLQKYLYSTDKWLRYYGIYSKLGMQKEIESAFNSLWNIKRDYRQNAYPEPSIYQWDYDYKRDGWKKLLELQLQNAEQTYENYLTKSVSSSSLND